MGSRPRHREETEAHGSAHRQGARRTRRCPASPPIPCQSRKGAPPPLPPVWPPSHGSGPGVGRALNLSCLGQYRPGHDSLLPFTSFRSTFLPRTPSRHVSGLLTVTLFLPGSLTKAAVWPGVGGTGAGNQTSPRPRPLRLRLQASFARFSRSHSSPAQAGAQPRPSRRLGPAGGCAPRERGQSVRRGVGQPDSRPSRCLEKRPLKRANLGSRGPPTSG